MSDELNNVWLRANAGNGWDASKGANWILDQIRASLQARLEGRNEGGDTEVMRLVDEIVKKENRLCSLCGQGSSCKCA